MQSISRPRYVSWSVALAILGALSACSTNPAVQPTAVYTEQQKNMLEQQWTKAEQPAINNRQVHLDMIKTMQSRSMYFASLAHIDAYEKEHGSNAELSKLRADALRATGQEQAARDLYQRLLSGNEAAAARHGLGLIAAQNGNYAEAVQQLRESVRIDPLNAYALGDLGYALMEQGDLDAARVPLIQAIELAPENRKVISNLALYLLLNGDQEKAAALMKKTNVSPEVQHGIRQRAQAMRSSGLATNDKADRELFMSNGGMQLRLQTTLSTTTQTGKTQ